MSESRVELRRDEGVKEFEDVKEVSARGTAAAASVGLSERRVELGRGEGVKEFEDVKEVSARQTAAAARALV